MAQIPLTGGYGTSGQTGLTFRTALTSMFTELYGKLHTRAHAVNSASDHSAATGSDKGKFLTTDATSGIPTLRNIVEDDIPATIARQTDLVNHIGDTDNPHEVTAEQLGITPPTAGAGLNYAQDGSINAYSKDSGGLKFNLTTHDGEIDPSNLSAVTDMESVDMVLIAIAPVQQGDPTTPKTITLAALQALLATTTTPTYRYNALTTTGSAIVVDVMASGEGITAAVGSGNTLTFTIPSGVKLISAKVRFPGYSTLNVKMGTVDMTNGTMANRWMPLVQAWREDTYQEITGVTTTMDSSEMDKFTINGLINTTSNHIRLGF